MENTFQIGEGNFCFDLKDMRCKDDFIKVGMVELEFLVQPFIVEPGMYALKLIVEKIDNA